MTKYFVAAVAALFLGGPALAQGAADAAITFTSPDNFEDTTFAVESAILDKGLVIDFTSHTGEMLERTRGDVGSDVVLFEGADIYNFCSAKLSREMMEADIMNIVYCPYRIFVMQQGGGDQVIVGFARMPEGPMQKVQTLLGEIVRDALGQ